MGNRKQIGASARTGGRIQHNAEKNQADCGTTRDKRDLTEHLRNKHVIQGTGESRREERNGVVSTEQRKAGERKVTEDSQKEQKQKKEREKDGVSHGTRLTW